MSRWIWAAVALLLAVLIVLGLRDPRLPVEMARVDSGALAVYVEEEVQTRVRQRTRVAAPVPGEIARVELRPGDAVVRGQLLVQLQAGPAPRLDAVQVQRIQAELAAAEADAGHALARLQAARAEAAQARREVERMRRLAGDEVVAVETLERAELALAGADAQQQAADALLAASRRRADALRALLQPAGQGAQTLDLVSPIDGVVLRRLRESAGPVAPGEVLLELGDPADIEIVGELLTEDAVQLSAGTPVELSGWGGEALLRARVERVEPGAYTKISALGVEEQRVLVIALPQAGDSDWPQLGDGYSLRARYLLWSAESVLRVPSAALQRDRDGWAVLRVVDGRAERLAVQVGHRNDQYAEVLQGLEAGDEVVLYADDRVRDGDRVAVVE